MQTGARKRVLIIQGRITHYRVPFFERLHAALEEDGVTLRVGYSDPLLPHGEEGDNCVLPPEYGVKVKAYRGLRGKLVWQPLVGEVAAADLVIVEHANKYVMNHLLLPCSAVGLKSVAFWGHGKNLQSQANSVSEWLKRQTLNWVNWWFAYTEGTAEYLSQNGVPLRKITSVRNAVDTAGFREQLMSISDSELDTVRKDLRISVGSRVGLFCGRIRSEKLPGFLVESVVHVKAQFPDFELLTIGSGPEQSHFESAAARYPWFHHLGRRYGREKAILFRLADIFLIPGAVGLAILDAFAAGLPAVTTRARTHGPENDYLETGRNGLLTPCTIADYSAEVIRLLEDTPLLLRLRTGALAASKNYSIETMVRKFHDGIMECLRTKPPRTPARAGSWE